MTNIFIACPSYDNRYHGGMIEAAYFPSVPHGVNTFVSREFGSLLPHVFNILWSRARNARKKLGITHFAMCHSDVEPEKTGLWTLVQELAARRADFMSAVVSIKSDHGVTSTGLYDPRRPQDPVRRLTLKEVHKLPETFSHMDFDRELILQANTGFWVCDFTKPWVDKVHFHFTDWIETLPDGSCAADCVPEDWNFSRDLRTLGCKVYCTRKVVAIHHGGGKWDNSDRGTWDTDQVYEKAVKNREILRV